MREMVGIIAVSCLALSCSSGTSEGHGPAEEDRSAFSPESGTIDDPTTEYDLRSARFKPLGVMASDVEVLYGHPDSAGMPFVLRIRELPGTIIPPHSHPVDEHITVVQGTWYFGLGEAFDSTALQRLTTGSYAFAPAGSTMFAYSPDLAVVQVHGIGPFHIHWREPFHVLSEPGTDQMFAYRIGQRVGTPRGPGEIREGYRVGALVQYEVVGDSLPLFMANETEVRVSGSQ